MRAEAQRWPATVARSAPPFGWMALALVLSIFVALGVGAVDLPYAKIAALILQRIGIDTSTPTTLAENAALFGIRLPRVIFAVAIGASLALGGALVQGLFRNPLADPMLLGISSGSAAAVACALMLGHALPRALKALVDLWGLPIAAFIGAAIAVGILEQLTQWSGRRKLTTMLLTGIAINAIALALTNLMSAFSTDEQLRTFSFWTFGSLGGATWPKVGLLFVLVGSALAASLHLAPALDALLLGEDAAGHLGLDVNRVRRQIALLVTLLVGVATAFSGLIGFVGLLVPHVGRLLVGPSHRSLLIGSAIAGAILMVLADAAARVVVAPAELPIGILTSLIGGPLFVRLLLTRSDP